MGTTTSGKPPIYQRKWAQITGSSALAFTVGMGAAGSSETQDMVTKAQAQALVDKAAHQAHDDATKAAERDALTSPAVLAAIEEARADATSAAGARITKLAAQRDRARARANEAEAAAAAAKKAAQDSANQVRNLAGSSSTASSSAGGDSGGTDPRFGTCGEANDHGYGPYTQGVDPEYDWYQDRDHDGDVCES